MGIKLELPKLTELKPRIIVIGVGGAGGNAVNNMIASGLTGVDFMVANTDAQALATSSAEHRIQLGVNLTEGLGAGSRPEIGEAAAEEAVDDIRSRIAKAHMVFLAAGMGGGTGTGAAAVMARIAKELGILTVAIVTKPFQFEGARRLRVAETGIAELKKHVDTLIVIPNQNLFKIANEKTTFAEAFVLADQVLYSGVACIIDLIVKDGLINLDFADVRTVMKDMGTAVMGTGEGKGERRAIIAAEEAITNRLLEDVSLRGAKGLLLSITGGRDLTLYEVDEAASRVRQEVDPEANIIVGATFDDSMGDRIRVAIVASGLASAAGSQPHSQMPKLQPPVRSAAPMPASQAPPLAQMADQSPAMHEPPPMPHQGPFELAPAHMPPPQRTAGSPSQHAPSGHSAPHSQQPSPQPPRPAREMWRAPGEVSIEEGGLPPLPISSAGPARTQPPPLEAVRPAEGFNPAPPEGFNRPVRRMPEIEDFPTIGQREFHAKAGHYPPPTPPPMTAPAASPRVYDDRPESPQQRRGGLFQRLTGRGHGE